MIFVVVALERVAALPAGRRGQYAKHAGPESASADGGEVSVAHTLREFRRDVSRDGSSAVSLRPQKTPPAPARDTASVGKTHSESRLSARFNG